MRLREVAPVSLLGAAWLAACSTTPAYVRPGDDGAAAVAEARVHARPGDRARANRLLASSQRKSEAGDLDGALADARAAQKADPSWVDPHTMIGLLANARGDAATAGRHFAIAAGLAPRDAAVLGNYGAWLCANGRAVESLDWFGRAVSFAAAPQVRADTLANAGACALKAGQADEAERAARAALGIDAGNAVALETLARRYYDAGRYFEARAFAERRLEAAPATPEVLRLASQIEEKLGDTVAATRYVDRLRTEFPQARIAGPGEAETP